MKIELRNDRHRFGAEHEMKMRNIISNLYKQKDRAERERKRICERLFVHQNFCHMHVCRAFPKPWHKNKHPIRHILTFGQGTTQALCLVLTFFLLSFQFSGVQTRKLIHHSMYVLHIFIATLQHEMNIASLFGVQNTMDHQLASRKRIEGVLYSFGYAFFV